MRLSLGKLADDSVDQKILDSINMNALGAMRALRSFLPLLRNRTTKKVINITSAAGSITLNTPEAFGKFSGESVPYGISKVLFSCRLLAKLILYRPLSMPLHAKQQTTLERKDSLSFPSTLGMFFISLF